MKISIAADHAGYELKEQVRKYLEMEGHEVFDCGPHSFQPGDDYPDFAAPAAQMVADGRADRGIVICDSGIGVSIVANKIPGIRCGLVHDEESAKTTREHNDTNVLALGFVFVTEEQAERIVKIWLETEFSHADRHERRIRKIEDLERSEVAHAHERTCCG